MATFSSFFDNTTITSQERELFTQLMGERNINVDDNIAVSKRNAPNGPKQAKSCNGRRRRRSRRRATANRPKASRKNVYGRRVTGRVASPGQLAWSVEEYEALSEALHLVFMHQARTASCSEAQSPFFQSADGVAEEVKPEEPKDILIPY
ncbi:uncharacterized protein BDV17DRAFT_274457 [Aspergillus undulatus]|uniref:uncharacterized protein n=1 Tax=Aspergillus undulatus TaxID=1810928 RepID=UPI003CCD203C